jgi:DHA1 family bicyclomycin/chloramphenicol resistance-like MFS transporter
MSDRQSQQNASLPGLGFKEFVSMIAVLMAVNALAIDTMLPALPQIGDVLGITHDNERQWIITSYVLGFGGAQLIYGPISDRYGRKPILIGSLIFFVIFSLCATFAQSFAFMIFSRVMQGVAVASTRVITVSIVRDCYSGRQMARVMSLSFIVFMIIPVLAPALGQLMLVFARWQWIFGAFALFGSVVALWVTLRLPETLHPEYRRPMEIGPVLEAYRKVVSNRLSVGYTLATTLMMGSLFGFIASIQQVVADVFGAADMLPLAFAVPALFMALAAFLNSRVVLRVGTRLLSHGALIGFIGFGALHVISSLSGQETLWSFSAIQMGQMFCFGLASANFGAMAMEPLGDVAGTAASVQGFVTTIGGAVCGIVIGQAYDHSTLPLGVGFTFLGMLALGAVLYAEHGRLFVSRSQSASA